ncbi:MAG: hypothetical protein IIZ99_00085 [Turicibacter sp.]|nr:hypothetical protein [Turicibacter sp.]
MCGYDPFGIYDYILDRQCADEMGFETVQDLYEAMNDDYERNRKAHLAGAIDALVRNTRNAR